MVTVARQIETEIEVRVRITVRGAWNPDEIVASGWTDHDDDGNIVGGEPAKTRCDILLEEIGQNVNVWPAFTLSTKTDMTGIVQVMDDGTRRV